jgi:Arc/MetJ family transcription regulator
MKNQITKDMDLEDLAAEVPKAIRLLTKRNIVCLRCGTPLWKTVEEAIHDAGLEDVEGIVKEINEELLVID